MHLILATRNAHKVEELNALCRGRITFEPLPNDASLGELPETGRTLEANSAQKALYVWEKLGKNCLADDSGLEVPELNGEPGVDSAHYAGTRDAGENMALLLRKLASAQDRTARFRCVLSVVQGGVLRQCEGHVDGHLLTAARGSGGFGYDPLFVPNGHDRTFAEMSDGEKNKLSHRARAVEGLLKTISGF